MNKLNKKTNKNKGLLRQAGMSYIELIVVLSIFSVISSVVFFNYGAFQAKIDIKNLVSDVALRIVEAQKSSLSGKLPSLSQQSLIINPSTWKPSYGIYVREGYESFVYFTDLNNDTLYNDDVNCVGVGECLERSIFTKGDTISDLDVFYQSDTTAYPLNDLTITFARPNSGAVIRSSSSFTSTISYVQITILSPKGITAKIKVYPSGRIQIN